MSGHSKWANIRVKKTAQDAKRGKVFTRHARLIEIAARAGGADPKTNSSLRVAIDNAKADSVPNDNIDRAIKKGTGAGKGEQMAEVLYGAMGPGGVACIIECLTDNRNRTLSNLKIAITKHGGSFAESSSVLWMFERKGLIVGKRESGIGKAELEELELELIDFGAEDFSVEENTIRIVTDMADWTSVRDFLKGKGWEILSAGLSFIAKQKVPINDQVTAEKLAGFIDAIEEDDDVSEVFTNEE